MDTIYAKLADLINADETVAVATIVDVKGSVPREVGAKMIIHPLGQHVGTVGGGCGEADVIRAALDVIQTGAPTTVRVDLTEDVSMQALGVCGGIMDVFVTQVAAGGGEVSSPSAPGGETPPLQRIAALRESALAREPVALATVISGPYAGREAVIWLDKPPLGSLGLGGLEPQVIADAQAVLRGRQHRLLRYPNIVHRTSNIEHSLSVFIEVQRRAPELIIVGGGHIAVPLAQMASMCDFAVTVLDDRPSFASPERFPTAQKTLAAPLRETVRAMPMDSDTFIVLVTRGHSHDVECLLEVLDRPVAYIGMIGSQRRVDAVFELLAEEQGIDPVKFDRVYAPIGIAIGARTPAEIAICIMAELINVLRGGPATSISEKRRERDRRRRGDTVNRRMTNDESANHAPRITHHVSRITYHGHTMTNLPPPLLAGLRVVDMTEALAGPYCTMYLGDMGADVIKIERRGTGDQTRGWGPPFVNGESAYFMSTNRNKRSLTLDVTTPQGQAILHRLIDGADIFVNNLPRFSSVQKLGIDPEACLARNPRLIHVSVTSFGHTGPRAGQPGYDILSQGMSGIMSLTGEPDGEPMRYPVPISDMTVGLYALIGILAALYERERTGRGQAIDAAILESQMGWLTNLAGSYFATGQNPPRMGNIHPTITPYQPFPTADGWIIIAGGTDRIWARLCDMLGIPPEVRDDPRYATNPQRNIHRAEVQAMLTERFLTQPKVVWLERLREADVPSGPIYLLGEALADPQLLARDFIVELEHPVAGLVRSLGFPPHLRAGAVSYRLPPPTLGQHTGAVLEELGLTGSEIASLRQQGVV